MDDFRSRTVERSEATITNTESDVGVFAISRAKGLVEAAEIAPEICGKRNRRARAIVHVLQIVELRTDWILTSTEVPGRSVFPQYPAGFLEAPVPVNELRTDKAYTLKPVKWFNETFQPARKNQS